MNRKIRAIFFDAGNTLLYPRLDLAAQVLVKHGYSASEEDFLAAERFGKKKLDEWLWPQIRRGEVPRHIDHYYWLEYFRHLMNRIQAPRSRHESLTHQVAETFRDIQTWSRVFPEAAPYLESLRSQGYFLGVISNSVGTIEEQLQRMGLKKYFHTVLDSAIVGVEKPHPEIFQLAISQAGCKAPEAVFVGDTYATDVGGAQLSGLFGVLIDRVGAYPDAECPRISTLPDLSRVLSKAEGAPG
ncbi:MAG TPA: HAD family hydrolase [Terriglobia bacterium]|nr:HAD family hydrolase [Terriglobia bacterium]